MPQTISNIYLQKLISTETHREYEFLGADTELSPEVIDFLNAPSSTSKTKAKEPHFRQINSIKLDEYEQAMVV